MVDWLYNAGIINKSAVSLTPLPLISCDFQPFISEGFLASLVIPFQFRGTKEWQTSCFCFRSKPCGYKRTWFKTKTKPKTCPEGLPNSKALQATGKKSKGDRKSYYKKWATYDEWAPVVLPILVLEENVNDGGGQGVEEGEDSDRDEELSRRRGVTSQCQLLPLLPLTGGHLKGHLVQPEEPKRRRLFTMQRRLSEEELCMDMF